MRIWVIVSSALLLAACVIAVAFHRFDEAPSGEGSYRAAQRILNELESMKVTEPKLPAGYYRFAFEEGGWYVATGTDSHGGPDGGTVGVLTSDGEFGVFFMHVCGGGEMPLEFPGRTPSEMMMLLRRSHPVYNRQQVPDGSLH